MKISKRTLIRLVLPVAVILLLMLWVTGIFHRGTIRGSARPAPEEPAQGLTTSTVTAETLPVITAIPGTVRAEQLATVTSRVPANILEIRVNAGRRVGSGETLALLDDRDFRQRVAQAHEGVGGAEAQFALAQSDYRRDKPLFEQKVISPFEFERTETLLKTAEANLHRLQEAAKEAEVGLSYTVIRSPFAGVIVDRLANVGDLAVPGKPLFTIYAQGRLWLEAGVPEEMLAPIRIGASMSVRIDAAGRDLRGTVVEIVPSSDPATRTIAVRAHLEDVQGIVPGMFGRLLVPAPPEEVITLPGAAVIRAGQLTMADVVEGGRVSRRTVQLGRTIGNRAEVLSGLAPGEIVVVRDATAATARKEKP